MRRTIVSFLSIGLVVGVATGLALARWVTTSGQDKKRVVTFVTLAPLERPLEEVWQAANVVAEIAVVREGPAVVAGEKARAEALTAVTPTTVTVKRLYRNQTPWAIDVGTDLVVLAPYGRAESSEYVVDTRGIPRLFTVGGVHVAFLDCLQGTRECRVCGPVFEMHGDDSLSAKIGSRDIVAMGVKKLRETLDAMKDKGEGK